MSEENVEFVRHVYESGLLDRDPDELLQLATADIEYVNPPYAVEPGVRHGVTAVAQAMRRFAEVWEASRHELRELYDCGDAVVAAVNWHIRGRGSERELVNKEAHTWTLREGRIARFEWGQDLGTALEAARLPGLDPRFVTPPPQDLDSNPVRIEDEERVVVLDVAIVLGRKVNVRVAREASRVRGVDLVPLVDLERKVLDSYGVVEVLTSVGRS